MGLDVQQLKPNRIPAIILTRENKPLYCSAADIDYV